MVNLISVLVSTLIWIYFLRRFDRYGSAKALRMLGIALGGGLLSVIVPSCTNGIAIDAAGVSDGFDSLSPGQALVISAAAGIGEEFSKALVAFLWLQGTARLREPIEAAFVSASVALGFAAIENLGYMSEFGRGVIVPRTLTAVPLHMGLAVLWGTALARARFQSTALITFRQIVPSVSVAAFIHAAYDFALMNSEMPPVLAILTPIIATVGLVELSNRRLYALYKESPYRAPGNCPSCGAVNIPFSSFCAACGESLRTEFYVTCPRCATRTERTSRFCPSCGLGLGTQAPL